jgi:hypothetical protein
MAMPRLSIFHDELESELTAERNELHEILQMPDDAQRVSRLRDLATKLGASTSPVYPGYGDAQLPELVHNIHFALQTKAMVATVRETSNYVLVSVILAALTFGSTLIALLALLKFK